jgi:hypothetical protein
MVWCSCVLACKVGGTHAFFNETLDTQFEFCMKVYNFERINGIEEVGGVVLLESFPGKFCTRQGNVLEGV